jgi:hypothetical protein
MQIHQPAQEDSYAAKELKHPGKIDGRITTPNGQRSLSSPQPLKKQVESGEKD